MSADPVDLDDIPPATTDIWPKTMLAPLGAWARDAACKNSPPEWFEAPEPGAHNNDLALLLEHQVSAAMRCAICPVRAECYADAVTTNAIGIWGGHLFREDRHSNGRPDRMQPIDLVGRLEAGRLTKPAIRNSKGSK